MHEHAKLTGREAPLPGAGGELARLEARLEEAKLLHAQMAPAEAGDATEDAGAAPEVARELTRAEDMHTLTCYYMAQARKQSHSGRTAIT